MSRCFLKGSIVVLLLSLGAGASPVACEEATFPTNLALLGDLTSETVSVLLDSLDVRPGESISLIPAAWHEGSDFVADAFASALARRGVAVRLASQVQATPAPPPDTSAVRRAGGVADEETAAPADSGFAAADSIFAASWGDTLGANEADSDTLGAGSSEPETEEEGEGEEEPTQEDQGQKKTEAPAAQVPAYRNYPEGTVIEFRVLEFAVSYPTSKRRLVFFGQPSVRRLGGVSVQASRIEGPKGKIVKVARAQSNRQDHLSGDSRLLAEGAAYPFAKPTIPPANIGKYIEPFAVLGIISSLIYLFYQNQK